MSALLVHRVVKHPSGAGVIRQQGTALEKDGKLRLTVHGLAATGRDAKPKTFNSKDDLLKAGWEEGN